MPPAENRMPHVHTCIETHAVTNPLGMNPTPCQHYITRCEFERDSYTAIRDILSKALPFTLLLGFSRDNHCKRHRYYPLQAPPIATLPQQHGCTNMGRKPCALWFHFEKVGWIQSSKLRRYGARTSTNQFRRI